MRAWLLGATLLCFALLPCAAIAFRGKDPIDRVVALNMGAILATLATVLLAEEMKRPLFLDLALTLSLLSFGGGLVFAKFLERWL